ncbi:predicted protein [Micromonas commoda]|uniref:Nuclear nucleic acid-binding protein C1D n=1 Tax=Micromonas commoda (strain RCC299 / NOUM17 / CCMP2709) TaxID=296587 RepID=C1DZE8_MICCC|nr:predicted protein [Micromonas commoda]ACO61105.1 predicted protein [Micromonas commoda]|eukprot:XP_002499847.1 predicted protein [Micromonas commoda]
MGEVKLPEDVKEQLEKFEAAVQEMEEGLTPLLSADRKEMEAALNPLERARVHIALANAVSTLYAMYIKTVGMDPADHGISRELERVDLYKGKVDKALKLGGPNTKLDVPAAERMINAAQGGKKKREANKDEAEDLIEEALETKKKGDKKKKKK